MSDFVGIDLGTTFSAVASIDAMGKPVVVPNDLGHSITPSVLYLGNGEVVAGEQAKEMQALGEQDVAFLFKRSMGDASFLLNLGGRDYNASQLSTLLLKKLLADATKSLGKTIKRAVITVPAYFDNHQRQATIEAGNAAGLEVMRIINEPTAAALAYGFGNRDNPSTLLVYDLGGGTFDVTLIRLDKDEIEVLGTSGDHQLGGRDWDDRIANYLAQQFEDEFGVNPLLDSESACDLLVRCEVGKKQLSVREKTKIAIVHQGEKGSYEITRDTFESLTRDLMERTTSLIEQTLEEVSLDWLAVEGVLLVGGSTRMPMVHQYVEEMSGKKPNSGINVDEAVALGAALQAAMDAEPKTIFRLPGMRRVVDVMSHSLGMIATNEDRSKYLNTIIIPKNKPIPCVEKRPFQLRTGRNLNNEAEVYMLQGESEEPTSCTVLGKYTFSSITHVQGDLAVLDIAYAYDNNGVVTVSASEHSTGKVLQLTHEPIPEDMSWLDHPPVEEQTYTLQHVSVCIAIDLSGSMKGEPLMLAQKAAKRFITELDLAHTSVGLIGFANKSEPTCHLLQDARKLNKGIDVWSKFMADYRLGAGTAGDPFGDAGTMLAKADGPTFLIVLTDGCWANSQRAIKRAQALNEAGVDIVALGFGTANQGFLQAIATSDENAVLTDISKISTSFSKIAQVLTEGAGQQDPAGPSQKRGLRIFG